MSRRESWVSHTAFPARVPAGGWSSSRNLKALFIFIAAAAGAPPPLGWLQGWSVRDVPQDDFDSDDFFFG